MKGLVSLVCVLALALCAMFVLPAAPAGACDHAQQFNAGGGCYAQNFRAPQLVDHHYGGQNLRAQQQADHHGGQDFRAGFRAGQRAQQHAGPQRVTTRTRRGLFGTVTTTVKR